jgi:outer membrane receptor protein involved in Fe transport
LELPVGFWQSQPFFKLQHRNDRVIIDRQPFHFQMDRTHEERLLFANNSREGFFGSRSLLATVLCSVFFLLVPGAQAQNSRVEGIVRDGSGASVPGAKVQLVTKSYSANVTTDSAGLFVFENVPDPTGTLTISAAGFRVETQPWKVSSDVHARVEVTLLPSSLNQQVQVTANRAATLLADVPVSDVELTQDDLQNTAALTLDDALRQIPGFSLFRRSSSRVANPTTQGVSLRGLGANGSSRALVLQDGIPLNDPFGGWVYWDRVPVESVSTIEVAQEGASSLYGSDALGGVVQFISRPAQPAGISLETSYGNQNTPDLSLWAGGQKGKWESTLSGELFNTDGYILIPKDDRGPVDTRAGSQHGTADLMVGRKIGESSEIFARGSYLDETRQNGTPLQTNDTKLGQGVLGANLQLGSFGALTLRFYADAQTYHQSFSSVSSVHANRDTELQTDLQTVPAQGVGGSAVWSRQFGKRQTIVAGFDDHEEIGASHDIQFALGIPVANQSSGGRERTVGIFGEDLIQITPKWLLSLSGRVDHWSNFDASTIRIPFATGIPNDIEFADRSQNAFSPRATLRNQLTSNISWNASIYRAFRAPTLNELYRSFRQGNTLTNSNAFLNAEHLTGGDAGIAVTTFDHRLDFQGTFFYNQLINPVANVTCTALAMPIPQCPNPIPNTILRVRDNLGRSTSPGFEIGATGHITHDFELSVGYQFVDSKVSSFPANPALVGLWIAQVPHNALTFQARYSNPRIVVLSIDGRMIGKQYDDDLNSFPLGRFFVLGVIASRSVGRGVELFGAVENLFNVQYDTAATPVPQLGLPIAARFGFRYEWPKR